MSSSSKIAAVSAFSLLGIALLALSAYSFFEWPSRDNASFEEISAVADSIQLPAESIRYEARDSEERGSSCTDARCPSLRRAYLVPITSGEAVAFARMVLEEAEQTVTSSDLPDCDTSTGSLCGADSRSAVFEVRIHSSPLGAVPEPAVAAPADTSWRLLYVDVHAVSR